MRTRFEIRVTGAQKYAAQFDGSALSFHDGRAETFADDDDRHRLSLQAAGEPGTKIEVAVTAETGLDWRFAEFIRSNGKLSLVRQIPTSADEDEDADDEFDDWPGVRGGDDDWPGHRGPR